MLKMMGTVAATLVFVLAVTGCGSKKNKDIAKESPKAAELKKSGQRRVVSTLDFTDATNQALLNVGVQPSFLIVELVEYGGGTGFLLEIRQNQANGATLYSLDHRRADDPINEHIVSGTVPSESDFPSDYVDLGVFADSVLKLDLCTGKMQGSCILVRDESQGNSFIIRRF